MAIQGKEEKKGSYEKAWSVIHEWWGSLEKSTGERANLRHSRNADAVATRFSYFNLFTRMAGDDIPIAVKKKLGYRLPLVAGIISHIKTDDPGRSVALAMGSAGKAGTDRPLVSDLRFRKLLRTEDDEELYLMMIRMIRMLGEKVNVKDMAGSVFFWNDQTRKRWAAQYYIKKDIYSDSHNVENI